MTVLKFPASPHPHVSPYDKPLTWLVEHRKGEQLFNIFEVSARSHEEALEKGSANVCHMVEIEVVVSYIEPANTKLSARSSEWKTGQKKKPKP